MKLPRIAITMGDAAGVGPELCLSLLADEEIAKVCQPLIFGDLEPLTQVGKQLDRPVPDNVVTLTDFQSGTVSSASIIDHGIVSSSNLVPGQVNEETGRASYQYIESAIDASIEGTVDAVVTCPINKEAWQQAGIKYPGHTELFAERAKTDRFCMMMTAPSFSCSLVTTHVGYHEVPNLLSVDRIVEVIQMTHDSLSLIAGRKPKLIALGLNPHAGEGGLFGNQEEENLIRPAVEQCVNAGIDIEGPIPPDTAFLPWRRTQTDGFVCMYHDQGLIPFKALNFDTGVNITLGLPSIIRTSVDHGTALDIAWQGKADVSSLLSAARLAAKLASKP